MKLAFYIATLTLQVSYAQTWYQIDQYPSTAIDDGICFKIDEFVYCGTGQTPWWSSQRNFYRINTLTDTWEQIDSLPSGAQRFYANAFSHNGKGFVFGGYNGIDFLNDLWIYDPLVDSWSPGNPLPSFGRSGAAQFQIDSFAYIIGGTAGTMGRTDEVWRLNLNDQSWTQLNDLPFGARWRGAAESKNGKGYYLFGRDTSDVFYDELFEYDPTLDNWSQINQFPLSGRSHASMINCADELYIIAGIDSLNDCHNDLWHYSVELNYWTELAEIPIEFGIRGGMCFASTNSIYFSTGIDQNNERVRTTWKLGYPLEVKQLDHDQYKIYPNPVHDILTIEIGTEEEIKIINSVGKEVANFTTSTGKNILNIKELQAGIYFVNSKDSGIFERILKL